MWGKFKDLPYEEIFVTSIVHKEESFEATGEGDDSYYTSYGDINYVSIRRNGDFALYCGDDPSACWVFYFEGSLKDELRAFQDKLDFKNKKKKAKR